MTVEMAFMRDEMMGQIRNLSDQLTVALDRIAKLEAEVKRIEAMADACPQCKGLPGMMCGICYGSGRKSGGRR